MYLAIDIGGTKTLVASINEQGEIQEQLKFATAHAYRTFEHELANTVARLTTKEFKAAGVAAPGRIDRARGTGSAMGNLPWKNVPIREDVSHIAGCPTVLDNDGNLAGLSEAMLLKDQHSYVLYITIGTGIGVGVIIDQEIAPALANSEGGHMLLEYEGKLQNWEAFASGKAIVKRFGKPASQITEQKTWRHIAHTLALGIVDLVAVLQPEVIVLGGGVSKHFDNFARPLHDELKRYETPLVPIPPIKRAQRPETAVLYGCYDLAKNVYG